MWRQGAATLKEMGYKRISHWSGGLAEWQKHKAPVEKWQQPIAKNLQYHNGTAYLIKTPKPGKGQPRLLVWCHPGDGDPAPEFAFLATSPLFSTGNVILLAPQARAAGYPNAMDPAYWH